MDVQELSYEDRLVYWRDAIRYSVKTTILGLRNVAEDETAEQLLDNLYDLKLQHSMINGLMREEGLADEGEELQ